MRQMHIKGMRALITSAMLIILVMSINYYLDLKQDESEARKLVDRELKIVDQRFLLGVIETEALINDLCASVIDSIHSPDYMFVLTREAAESNPYIKAAAIAFEAGFFPGKGHWYEPRTVRRGDRLITEQIGSAAHDYLSMEWYRGGLSAPRRQIHWSAPYIDHSQDEEVIISAVAPLCDKTQRTVGAVCVDISLTWVRHLLKNVEPYEGSVCRLLDTKGHELVASAPMDSAGDYFIASKEIQRHQLVVELACPKKAIYGVTTQLNMAALALLIIGIVLLLYIVRRSFRNFRELQNAHHQQHMIDSEMRIAHRIQMSMLRTDFSDSVHASLLPMKEVGGDLYDFYQDGSTLYFIIGDVSGKGIPAAMTMAGTVNLFRMAARHYSTPSEIVSEINHVLSERNPSMMFVTAFVGKLDMQHGLLTYCNAGHNPPVLNTQPLKTDPDIPIGFRAEYAYRQYGALFPEGSRLVLYTDGISEARDAQHKMLGARRLVSIAAEHYKEPADQMTQHIAAATRRFAEGAEQTDDMTLMCVANNTPQQIPALSIQNDIAELERVKPLLREYCDCLGCDRRTTRKIMLAVEEAVANVVNYAYPKGELGRIDIDIMAVPAVGEQVKGDLTVIVSDSGQPFDPTAKQPVDVELTADSRQVGGLGIYLYQQLMDTVVYERTDDGRNVLRMTKEIV